MTATTEPRVVRFGDCVDEPWPNGGGTTRVLAVDPRHSTGHAFDWRLSVATVSTAAFSELRGVDRVLTLVDGPPLTLRIDGDARTVDPFRPIGFAGESSVRCETTAPGTVFNVMTRRGGSCADVGVRIGSGHVAAPLGSLTFVVVVGGAATVRQSGRTPVTVARFDCVRLGAAADLSVRAGGRVAVVRIKVSK